ncbi:MAG: hypothetical protein H6Q68_1250 [Firmicutes bacterium]|nr:hypothetical protein [Bacillota bacterium]
MTNQSNIDKENKNNASASFFCYCEYSEAISGQVGDCFLVPRRNDSQKLILSDFVKKPPYLKTEAFITYIKLKFEYSYGI